MSFTPLWNITVNIQSLLSLNNDTNTKTLTYWLKMSCVGIKWLLKDLNRRQTLLAGCSLETHFYTSAMLLDVTSEQICPLSQTPVMSAAQCMSAFHITSWGSISAHSCFTLSHILKNTIYNHRNNTIQ